jgi:uncharacterized protein (DUF2384 family)
MTRLLKIVNAMIDNSDALEARNFSTPAWPNEFAQRPQPVLRGRKPSEMLGTRVGFEAVAQVLRAMETGAYL